MVMRETFALAAAAGPPIRQLLVNGAACPQLRERRLPPRKRRRGRNGGPARSKVAATRRHLRGAQAWVGFVPDNLAPINNLGLSSNSQHGRNGQDLSMRYKTGTVNLAVLLPSFRANTWHPAQTDSVHPLTRNDSRGARAAIAVGSNFCTLQVSS